MIVCLAAVAAALVVAACGGHAATRKNVIARGNAICFSTLQSIHSVTVPASLTGLPELAAYLHKVLPLVRKQTAQLRDLPRPQAGRATLDRFIQAESLATRDYAQLAVAASHGDQAGVGEALSKLRDDPTATLARRYGLRQCTGSVATRG